jgi:predicted DNA-binding protein (MmcQ/YjbR family)
MLATSRPEQFFMPPYVAHLAWIGVRLDRDLGWEEIEGVIGDAYHVVMEKMPRASKAQRRPGGAGRTRST